MVSSSNLDVQRVTSVLLSAPVAPSGVSRCALGHSKPELAVRWRSSGRARSKPGQAPLRYVNEESRPQESYMGPWAPTDPLAGRPWDRANVSPLALPPREVFARGSSAAAQTLPCRAPKA